MKHQYLKKRHQTWYVSFRVPADLKDRVGKIFITKSLQTHDVKEADRLKHGVIAEFQKYFDSLRKTVDTESPVAQMKELAKSYKQKINLGLTTQEEAHDEWCYDIDDYFVEYHETDPLTNSPIISPEILSKLELADEIVKNPDLVLMSDALDIYLDHLRGHIREQTMQSKTRRIKEFMRFLKLDKEPRNVSKREASAFVVQYLTHRKLAVTTKKDFISDLSAFFRYLRILDLVKLNPFEDASKLIIETSRGIFNANERREWAEEELKILLNALIKKNDRKFTALTLIALYGGLRSNEICECTFKYVFDTHMFVSEGKNDNSVRGVPFHPIIKPLILKLVDTKQDDYLIPGLMRGGKDKKRNHYFSKDFGKFKKKIGIPSNVCFHCFRNCFCGVLDRLRLPQRVIAQIVGHEKDGITFKVYSDGQLLQSLINDVSSVSYGKDVDKLAMQLVADF